MQPQSSANSRQPESVYLIEFLATACWPVEQEGHCLLLGWDLTMIKRDAYQSEAISAKCEGWETQQILQDVKAGRLSCSVFLFIGLPCHAGVMMGLKLRF